MACQLDMEVVGGLSPAIADAASAAAADRRFLMPCWFGAGDDKGLRTLVVRGASGTCIAAVPVRRIGPLRTVPGSYWPFRSFPVVEGAAGNVLNVRSARRLLGWAFRMGPICEDDPALALLRQGLQGSGYRLLEREAGRCFIHDVDSLLQEGPWPHKSALQRNARRERLLAQSGPVRWEFVRGSGWTSDVFDRMAAVEKASWLGGKQNGADCKFSHPRERKRWEALAENSEFAGYMSACLLMVGERPVAFSFDLDVGATRWGIASGYDRAFHQQSPGRLLHYRNTEEAIRRGIRLINWGSGDSGYKRQLGAVPGPRLLDCMFVRDLPLVRQLARSLWRRPAH